MLIDLCSVAVLHRFSSPAWWEAIVKHVSADFSSNDDAFDHVVKLKVRLRRLGSTRWERTDEYIHSRRARL